MASHNDLERKMRAFMQSIFAARIACHRDVALNAICR